MVLILLTGLLSACSTIQPVSTQPPRSSIRVVMDNNYPPYVFENAQGQVQGILVDQWNLWAERTGVKVTIVALPWGEALERMKAGEFDVIDTIFYTEERARFLDFTDAYVRIDVPIFFQKNISGIANANDLSGFRVAVKAGDANADYLLSKGVTDLVYYDSYEAIVQAAARKEVIIFVIDQPPGLYYLYKYGIQDQFNYSAPLYSGEFHRAVKKGDTALLNLVQDGFSRISEVDYREIYRRWFGTSQTNSLEDLVPYLILVAAAALLVVGALVAFNRTLQERVYQRTKDMEDALANLEKSERRLRAIFDAAKDISFIITDARDPEPTVLEFSPGAEQIFGYTRDEMVGHKVSVLHLPEDAARFPEAHQLMRESKTAFAGETTLVRRSGEKFPAMFTTYPLMDDKGKMVAALGVSTDITERKRTDEALRQSRRFLSDLIENSGALIFVKDCEGRYELVNRRWEEVTGLKREEVIGKTDEVLFPGPVSEQFRANDLEVIETGDVLEREEYLDAAGGRRFFLSIKFPVRSEDGSIRGVCGMTTEITERKQAEQALRQSETQVRKLNAELEQRVIERTGQLEMANKELEAFAYSVSHDLRAPLRAIDGYSRLVIEEYAGGLDAEGQLLLERVRTASQNMSRLIDALLSLSRMTRTEMRRQEIDLSAFVRMIAGELQQGDPGRQVEWVIAENVTAQGDAQLIRVVLENLLGNAWKFTSRQERARIEFKVEQRQGERVYCVCDNGVGFDMIYAHKLFGAFQRLHRVDEFEGMGIGLATVQRIVRRHGGRAWAEAEVDRGAKFYFTLE